MTDVSDHDHAVRFSMLGPIRVWRDGAEVGLGPRQLRLILGMLLARAGDPVSPAEFIDALWDGAPPASAVNTVHRYVGALRRLLEPGLPPRSTGSWLLRRSGAYLLRVDAGCLDLLAFRGLIEQAHAALLEGAADTALAMFTKALGLWRGPCAADLEPLTSIHPAFVNIEHEYVAAVCEAAAVALRRDRATTVLPFLRQAAELHQLDESLHASLLLALAAAGKQAEALTLYQELRRRLDEELGVGPGPELQAAYGSVLRQRLAGRRPATSAGGYRDEAPTGSLEVPSSWVRPAQLPAGLSCFTGRQEALASAVERLEQRRPGTRILAVDGLPGIGKTAFAIHLAHRLRERFPDGQLYADLGGFAAADAPTTPHQILGAFLSSLGTAQRDIPADTDTRAALYRSVLAERRLLVVLDNARDLEQVRPLVPGAPACAVLVTSRGRLTGLATAFGARLLGLALPSHEEAVDMFLEHVAGRGQPVEMGAVGHIVDACGRLPLALAIVAARAAGRPDQPLSSVAAELAGGRQPLDVFNDDHLANDVRSVFSWSYRALSPQAARLFRLLPLHEGPDVAVSALASMAGVSPRAAEAALGEMTRTRLVSVHRRDHYRVHDLVLAYAGELGAVSPTTHSPVTLRLLGHGRETARAADPLPQAGGGVTPPPLPAMTPWPAALPSPA
ncbi:BTAD domain-containing putative transcriptional regulator [Streptomyces seoulensis]